MKPTNSGAFPMLFLVLLLIISSCAVQTSDYLKTRTKKNGKLYYVKTTEFSVTNDVDYEFMPDFTINTSDTLDSPNVRMNFYLNGVEPIESLKRLVLKPSLEDNDSLTSKEIYIDSFKQFFIKQKDEDEWVNRYSCKMRYPEFLKVLKSGNKLKGNFTTKEGLTIQFKGDKNWQKRKETLYKLFTHSIDQSTS